MIDKTQDNWNLRTIKSLCYKVTSGGTPSRKKPEYFANGTIPWIKTGELDGWYIYDAKEWITQEAIENSSAKLFPEDTVLMAMYGQGNTITTVGILGCEASTNQACCAMIVNPECCDPYFLLYSLRANKDQLLKLAFGASQRNLSVKTISGYLIPTPSLKTQRRIAQVLSAYDDLIENNTRRIKALEQAAHDLYREWFVEFRFPGHEAVPLVDSELGQIPQGWSVSKIDELANVGRGSSPRPIKNQEYFEGGDIPWIKIADATSSGKFLYKTKQYVNEYGASFSRFLPKGSLIVAASGTLGYVQILGVDGCVHDGWLYLNEFENVYSQYLYQLFLDRQKYFENSAYGAAIQNINTGIMREMDIILPPLEIQDVFSEYINEFDELTENLEYRNSRLREARDLLLPRLVSGELDVSDIELPMEES